MPYSFTEIERDKSKTIAFVFASLIAFYFATTCLIALVVKNYMFAQTSLRVAQGAFFLPLTPGDLLIALGIAGAVGFGHWSFSVQGIIPRITGILGAEPLHAQDAYHQVFRNILDEVSVATGGKKVDGIVVPVTAMNAFALADFKGNAVIGVTEGLLARLNRAQLEAVVGHEMAHVASGDCLATTVSMSIFSLYNGILSGLQRMLRGRGDGRGKLIIFILYLIFSCTRFLSLLINMFISREREFRADAVAVRLTRDPLSLAQALYLISHRWRGSNLPGEELEAIFIMNPKFNLLDESSGFLADLFSTHPPVEKRLSVLLDMAHSDIKNLEEELSRAKSRPRQPVPEAGSAFQGEWLVFNEGRWLGPYLISDLLTFNWIRPDMWVKKMGEGHILHAYQSEDLKGVFEQSGSAGNGLCPRCQVSLSQVNYEGAQVLKCHRCQGVLAYESDIQKILIREDVGFSDEVAKEAGLIRKEAGSLNNKKAGLKTADLLCCPNCRKLNARMNHIFYSYEYLVEIDRCVFCSAVWFDRNELEVLQYLIERNVREHH